MSIRVGAMSMLRTMFLMLVGGGGVKVVKGVCGGGGRRVRGVDVDGRWEGGVGVEAGVWWGVCGGGCGVV